MIAEGSEIPLRAAGGVEARQGTHLQLSPPPSADVIAAAPAVQKIQVKTRLYPRRSAASAATQHAHGHGQKKCSQDSVAEDAGHDPARRRVHEERKVEEREEYGPARAEEEEARAVAHVDGEEVMPEVEAAREPGGDRELSATDVGGQPPVRERDGQSGNAPR